MPSISGQDFQHAQIRASLSPLQPGGAGGVPILITSFTALNYKVRANKKPVRDSQGNIRGFTVDNKEIEGQLSLLQSEWVNLRRQILQQVPVLSSGGNVGQAGIQAGILTVQFDLNVSYGNMLTQIFTDQLKGVMFNEDAFDSKNDQEAITKDVPLFITDVIFDNASPLYYRPY